MSGIPEEDIWTQVENLKCSLDKCPSKEGEEIWRDAVRWAERFYWDARVTPPTPGVTYLVWQEDAWAPLAADNLGFWEDCLGGMRISSWPYYKPMPPAPEDER